MDSSGTIQRKGNKKVSTNSTIPTEQRHKKPSNTRLPWRKHLLVFIVMVSAFVGVLYFLPSPIDPLPLNLPSPPVFEGPLAPNQLLQRAEKLLVGRVAGPEAFEIRDGVLYTGTADGRIVMIKDEEIKTVARFGSPPCGLEKDEHTCGRPLGMRFSTDGLLYVLDAYLGMYTVNVETGETVKLLCTSEPIHGKPVKFLNDLDIQSDGIVYFTDSSQLWHRRDNRHIALENRHTGRAFRYNPKTGEISVIMDGLHFANGVQLSPDEDFLLVAETTYARISKYHLKGPKKGQVETFADNLPGLVDNIRPRQAGGYWVGIAFTRKQPFSFYDFITARPWLSKLATKLLHPNWIIKLMPKYGLLIALDQDGRIIQSLHDTTGHNIASISTVLDTGKHLYLGSYYAKFIGRLNISSYSLG